MSPQYWRQSRKPMITKVRLELEREYKKASDDMYDKAERLLCITVAGRFPLREELKEYANAARRVRRLTKILEKL